MKDEKRVPPTHATEVSGELEVQRVAVEAGWLYRPRAGLDVGIDLELEPVVAGVPTGRIIKAQVKSGVSYFERDNRERFAFRADAPDVRYWRRVNTPLLIVLYHPGERAAYAVEFHEYARANASELSKGLIWFERQHDRLTAQKLHALHQRETASSEDGTPVPLPPTELAVRESLHSNVLALPDTPERLFHAPISAREDREVRQRVGYDAAPFLLWNGELWAFADPRVSDAGLSGVVDAAAVRILDVAAWLTTKDGDIRYRTLLYRHIRRHTRALGLRADSEDRLFFPSLDGTPRTQRYRSLRQWTKRWVARPIWDRKRTRVALWEHRALKAELTRVGSRWFLSMLPAWCFTSEGRVPVKAPLGAVTRRISHEYNLDVYRLLVFWRAVLFRNEQRPLSLQCPPQRLTVSHEALTAAVEFGILGDKVDLSQIEDAPDEASEAMSLEDEIDVAAEVSEHA